MIVHRLETERMILKPTYKIRNKIRIQKIQALKKKVPLLDHLIIQLILHTAFKRHSKLTQNRRQAILRHGFMFCL